MGARRGRRRPLAGHVLGLTFGYPGWAPRSAGLSNLDARAPRPPPPDLARGPSLIAGYAAAVLMSTWVTGVIAVFVGIPLAIKSPEVVRDGAQWTKRKR